MNVNSAFETNNVAAILECYVDFITNPLNEDYRKRGGKELKVPYALWKNANGMRPFLRENVGASGWKRWEKIVSDFQREHAEEMDEICPKFAATFPTIVKEKIKAKKDTQKKFERSVENAIQEFENSQLNNTLNNTASKEVSEIISLLSSGATEIVSPGGWAVKVQS